MNVSLTTLIVVAALLLLILGGVLGMAISRSLRSKRLKDRFGPEYDRAVDKHDNKSQAEEELEGRVIHAENLEIRPLTAAEVNHFALAWQNVQAEFVDAPLAAAQKANRLIRDVMSTRGYPVEDFEQRAADISVEDPELATHYRELRALAQRDEGEPFDTEEIRQAMLHGRELFHNLLQPGEKAEESHQKETA